MGGGRDACSTGSLGHPAGAEQAGACAKTTIPVGLAAAQERKGENFTSTDLAKPASVSIVCYYYYCVNLQVPPGPPLQVSRLSRPRARPVGGGSSPCSTCLTKRQCKTQFHLPNQLAASEGRNGGPCR